MKAECYHHDKNTACAQVIIEIYTQIQTFPAQSDSIACVLNRQDQLNYLGRVYTNQPWCLFKSGEPSEPNGLLIKGYSTALSAVTALLKLLGVWDCRVYPAKVGGWVARAELIPFTEEIVLDVNSPFYREWHVDLG